MVLNHSAWNRIYFGTNYECFISLRDPFWQLRHNMLSSGTVSVTTVSNRASAPAVNLPMTCYRPDAENIPPALVSAENLPPGSSLQPARVPNEESATTSAQSLTKGSCECKRVTGENKNSYGRLAFLSTQGGACSPYHGHGRLFVTLYNYSQTNSISRLSKPPPAWTFSPVTLLTSVLHYYTSPAAGT